MFAKSGKGRANVRKRNKEEEEAATEDNASAVIRNKKQATGALFASTSSGPKKKDDFSYESARTVVPTIGQDNNALAPAIDEEEDRGGGVVGAEESSAGGKLYKGQAGYQKLILKGEVMDKKATSIGPIKAPTNVRLTCRFDYQPDLCKDYKETGYCTFGDSCKFMHDRGDYKAGWELDRDWEKQQEKKKLESALREMEGGEEDKEIDEMEDGLPFACAICRGPFKTPVETRCMHYFCEGCALGFYTKNKRCFTCNEQTFGQFNTAVKLVAKQNRLKAKKEALAEKEPEFKYTAATGGGDSTTGFQAEGGWAIPGSTFQEGKQV